MSSEGFAPDAANAVEVRERFEDTVARNEVCLDTWWARPRRAYALQILIDPAAASGLADAQEAILRAEPAALLRVPGHALHVSVMGLISVFDDFATPKDEIWAANEAVWRSGLNKILDGTPSFCMRYRWLVATDTAIIAVAAPAGAVNDIRTTIASTLDLPGMTHRGKLAHTTLFRYAAPLAAPKDLLALLRDTHLDIPLSVTKLNLVREEIFPALRSSPIDSWDLTCYRSCRRADQ